MVDKISTLNNNAVTSNLFVAGSSSLKIAVIDDFSTKSVFIDSDKTPDISHGQVVRRFVEEGLPGAQIDSLDIKSPEDNDFFKRLNQQLDCVLASVKDGKKYDAINLSAGSDIDFGLLSEALGTKITPENLVENRDLIRSWIDSVDDNCPDKEALQVKSALAKLSRIANEGIEVYVSSGNSKEAFNSMTLADGIKIVGAFDSEGEKADCCKTNSLINSFASGVFSVKKIKDEGGQTGFDFTRDDTIDVFADETSSKNKKSFPYKSVSTSISAPNALVESLKNR